MVRRDLVMHTRSKDNAAELVIDERTRVTAMTESTPGIWTVTAGESVVYVRAAKDEPAHYQRLAFTADAVIANDPTFDEAVFDLAVPPGFRED
jgi:hypothetical protein